MDRNSQEKRELIMKQNLNILIELTESIPKEKYKEWKNGIPYILRLDLMEFKKNITLKVGYNESMKLNKEKCSYYPYIIVKIKKSTSLADCGSIMQTIDGSVIDFYKFSIYWD